MKLKSIHLQNFRLFKDFRCDFDERLTVLVANNGGGKTSLLEGVCLALYPFTGYFPGTGIRYLSHDDVHTHIAIRKQVPFEENYPVEIDVQAKLAIGVNVKNYQWRQLLDNGTAPPLAGPIDTVDPEDKIDRIAEIHRYFHENANWPLIAFYRTNRLSHAEKFKSGTINQAELFSQRNAGYSACTNASSSFSIVLNWFDYAARNNAAEFSRYLAKNPDVAIRFSDFTGPFSPLLKAVQNAVNTVLAPTGWKNISYVENLQDAVLEHDEFGTQPVSRLSDGLRTTIGLVADLAFRAVQLNSHLGENAAQETGGIVMIDEVDMHLHPQWQQTILPDLLRAFPKVQFIVTTHSPQVLSTVKRENIRLINKDGAEIPLAMTYGEESGNVLEAVMDVDQEPPFPERAELDTLERLVEQGRYSEETATALISTMMDKLGENHPRLRQMQRSIRRQETLKKLSATGNL